MLVESHWTRIILGAEIYRAETEVGSYAVGYNYIADSVEDAKGIAAEYGWEYQGRLRDIVSPTDYALVEREISGSVLH